MKTVKRSEWVWVSIFAGLVLLLTSAPYLIGALRSDANWHFSGFVIGVEDGNSYLAKMQLGAHGQWLFQLSYAVEDHPAALVFPFFILLGKVVGAVVGTRDPVRLHAALAIGFHLARVFFGFGQILVSYRFIAELLPRVRQRRLALMLAVLGGGLGWLLIAIPQAGQPLEFYSPEAFSFLHLYSLPHLAAVRVLFLSGLLCYVWAIRGRWQWAFAAGVCWFGLTLIQPFYMVIIYALLALHVVIVAIMALRQGEGEVTRGVDLGAAAIRALWVSVLAGAFGLPLVLYTFLLFLVDPIYQVWGSQNLILSPAPWHYLSAWGLCAVLGLLGLRSLYRRQPLMWTLVVGWLLVVPILLYVPYNLQRRFAEGVFVPLSALAILGLTVGLGRLKIRRWVARYGPLLLIALSLPATGLVWAGGLVVALNPRAPVYQSKDQVATYAFLGQSLPTRAVVVSAYEFGNAVPAYGHLVAYIGHGPETPYLESKKFDVNLFFDPLTLRSDRREVYNTMGAPYVVVTPQDRLNGFNPARQTDYLQKIFEAGDYSVWSLK